MPSASSPMLRRTASSNAVMPPTTAIFPRRPYSLNCLKKRKPFEPAKPRKIPSTLVFSWAM